MSNIDEAAIAPYKARIEQLTGMKFSDRMHAALVSRAEKAEAEVAKLRELLAELLVAEKLDDDDPRLVSARLAAEAALREKA